MYLVYGLQKSGLSIVKYLQKNNEDYKIWDDSQFIRYNLKKQFKNSLFYNPKIENINQFKKIFVSPGISLKHKNLKFVKKQSALSRDLNLYISKLKNHNIIAITGTNGKSTTTKLIGDILFKNNIKTFVGGNIGEPLCNSLLTNINYKIHVIELSSFQLETIKNINTKISIITNLSNDHLDRYSNIQDYINQKKNIITKTGINLISIDDQYSKKIFSQKKIKNKISFSINNKSADVYIGNNYILDNYFKNNRKLLIQKISKDFEGKFNNQNIVIAYICCKLLKIPEKVFLSVLKNFKGLPFRSKVIFKDKGLKIINNSKSTNINSAINSIKNYYNIYLIIGGQAKEKNFEIISKYKQRIKCVYLFGSSRHFIEKKLTKTLNTKKFKNLNLLVNKIFKDLKIEEYNSCVLFSPACASYDQYKNFEDRGIHFDNLINTQLNKL